MEFSEPCQMHELDLYKFNGVYSDILLWLIDEQPSLISERKWDIRNGRYLSFANEADKIVFLLRWA